MQDNLKDDNSPSEMRETFVLASEVDYKDIKPFLFRFMQNYFLEKCRHSLHEQLDDFLQEYQSPFELNWHKFVKTSFHSLYTMKSLQMTDLAQKFKDELQIVLDIIIRIPIKREIKNEIGYLQQKVRAFASKYELILTQEEIWSGDNYWKNFLQVDKYIDQLSQKVD